MRGTVERCGKGWRCRVELPETRPVDVATRPKPASAPRAMLAGADQLVAVDRKIATLRAA